MDSKYIMALDQGTTSSRCVIYDNKGRICSMQQKEFEQIYPKAGWIEHNPVEIWSSQLAVAMEAMVMAGLSASDIEAIGITNQRETTIVWERATGRPVYNAIVWQCRRTSERIDRLKAEGMSDKIRRITGLIPDAYFSASKIEWILDNVPGAREKAENGELLLVQLIHGLYGILPRAGCISPITRMRPEPCCTIYIICAGAGNCLNILIFRSQCFRKLNHQAVYTQKVTRRYSAEQYLLQELRETSRRLYSDNAVLNRAKPKIHTEQAAFCL